MRARSFAHIAVASLIGLSLSACSATDGPSAPTSQRAPSGSGSTSLLGGLLGTTTTNAKPLTRTVPLASPITVSKRIGVLGGSFSIPQAGLTVVVPPLAVLSTTTFTATALAGSAVAYDFSPHTHFAAPLVATQSLAGTAAATGLVNPLSLYVGYFPDSNHPTSITEILTVGVDLLNLTSTVTLWHFSGYVWASGAESDF